MSDCLLILYWPDFRSSEAQYSPSAALVAHSLQRQLCLHHDDVAAYVWDPTHDGGAPPVSAFRRAGMRLLQDSPGTDTLVHLAWEHSQASRVVLAMDPARASEALPALTQFEREVEVWTPDASAITPAGNGASGAGVRVRELSEVLHLTTAHSVGFFADWRCLQDGLKRSGVPQDPAAGRESLLRAAELVGTLTTARFYGETEGFAAGDPQTRSPLNGSSEPAPPGIEQGSGPAADELRSDLWQLLEDPSAPETWIIAAEAAWLPELIREAHAQEFRVLLWLADEKRVPAEVRAEADSVADLAPLFHLVPARRERSAGWRASPGMQADVRVTVNGGPRPSSDSLPVELRDGPTGADSPVGGTGARLSPWVRLAYRLECLLRQNQTTKIPFRKLAAALAETDEFGPSPANATMWLSRARGEGVLLVEEEAPRADPAHRIALCRANPEHPAARVAVEAPDRCLRLLYQMLQKIPWVSFKLLRNVLLREQWLGGPPYRMDDATIDEWLNFLIHDGAIRMTKEPNLVNPDYPVTALRLNEEHPLSRLVVTEATESTRLGAERAVLAVDHFLTRNRKPWMAMGALRRALDGMGREELQAILQGLQNLGALVTESYPNPQKEHFTTGCRLNSDEPLVEKALTVRNSIIRVAQQHQRYRSWVPLSILDDELSAQCAPVASAHRLAWFLLLRDEGVLELDGDNLAPESAWKNVRCRLNVSDPVVRMVVAEHRETSEPLELAMAEH